MSAPLPNYGLGLDIDGYDATPLLYKNCTHTHTHDFIHRKKAMHQTYIGEVILRRLFTFKIPTFARIFLIEENL